MLWSCSELDLNEALSAHQNWGQFPSQGLLFLCTYPLPWKDYSCSPTSNLVCVWFQGPARFDRHSQKHLSLPVLILTANLSLCVSIQTLELTFLIQRANVSWWKLPWNISCIICQWGENRCNKYLTEYAKDLYSHFYNHFQLISGGFWTFGHWISLLAVLFRATVTQESFPDLFFWIKMHHNEQICSYHHTVSPEWIIFHSKKLLKFEKIMDHRKRAFL